MVIPDRSARRAPESVGPVNRRLITVAVVVVSAILVALLTVRIARRASKPVQKRALSSVAAPAPTESDTPTR
jgi:hypothetical protein